MRKNILKKYSRLFFILLLILTSHLTFSKEKSQVALVIGNSDYINSPLKNPVNDANSMSKSLASLGFKVIKGINLTRKETRLKIREFGKALKSADVGLFYYAGHGVQSSGENFLIPINADINEEYEIWDEAISASSVLRSMENAGNPLNIVILDACRNNPFARSFRSSSRGLSRIEGPDGSIIAYATSPGKVAADGQGGNGLYTHFLLKYMNEPGLKVEDVFKKVRIAVKKETAGKQVPWENSSLMGDFYFSKKIVISQAPINIAISSTNQNQSDEVENRFWDTVLSVDSADGYEAYIEEYKNGHYIRIAKIKIKYLNKKEKANNEIKPIIADAKLTIRSNVNDDTVKINGENKGSTRLDITLKSGSYNLEVSKNGYTSWNKNLEIKAGLNQVVYAKLRKLKPTIIPKPSITSKPQVREVKPSRPNTTTVTISKKQPEHKANSTNKKKLIKQLTKNMIHVKAGCFSMGESKTNNYFSIFNNASVTGYGKTIDKFNNKKHDVCLSRDFMMSRFEVTQKVWMAMMGINPSHFKRCGENCPVEQVSWRDVQQFIKKLNQNSTINFRLPTEAEWEYVASSTHRDNNKSCKGNTTHSVGIKSPNNRGVYDMTGNVWEWVNDWYGDYAKNKVIDPPGPTRGAKKVIRGGSWLNTKKECTPYSRRGSAPYSKEAYIGFRLVAEQK